jgi:hypothetical protein
MTLGATNQKTSSGERTVSSISLISGTRPTAEVFVGPKQTHAKKVLAKAVVDPKETVTLESNGRSSTTPQRDRQRFDVQHKKGRTPQPTLSLLCGNKNYCHFPFRRRGRRAGRYLCPSNKDDRLHPVRAEKKSVLFAWLPYYYSLLANKDGILERFKIDL